MTFLAYVLIAFAVGTVVAGLYILIEEELSGLLVIACAMLAGLLGFIILSSVNDVDIQQITEKQGITASYNGGDLTTDAPCKINLELQNGELVMRGTNSVVTHDKLESICTTLAK